MGWHRYNYNDSLRIYTDGCAFRNGQRGAAGGWAIVFEDEDSYEFEDESGYCQEGPQTNNRYELKAIEQALRRALRGGGVYDVTIVTDSHYAINSMTNWIRKWQQNDWLTCKGKPVVNRRLIENIDSMKRNMEGRGGSVKFEYVNAHSGDYYNEQADTNAKEAAANNPLYCY